MRGKALFAAALISLLLISGAVAQQASLKDAYQGCFLVGAALAPAQFTEEDAREAEVVKAQFNTITPENVLKWEVVHPRPDT